MVDCIYHISLMNDFLESSCSNIYSPSSLKEEGFVHCSFGGEIGKIVLNKYFANVEVPIVILKIETAKVVSRVKFEDPSPLPQPGDNTYPAGTKFPHIYGQLNLDAVIGYSTLEKSGHTRESGYEWPDKFEDAESLFVKIRAPV